MNSFSIIFEIAQLNYLSQVKISCLSSKENNCAIFAGLTMRLFDDKEKMKTLAFTQLRCKYHFFSKVC